MGTRRRLAARPGAPDSDESPCDEPPNRLRHASARRRAGDTISPTPPRRRRRVLRAFGFGAHIRPSSLSGGFSSCGYRHGPRRVVDRRRCAGAARGAAGRLHAGHSTVRFAARTYSRTTPPRRSRHWTAHTKVTWEDARVHEPVVFIHNCASLEYSLHQSCCHDAFQRLTSRRRGCRCRLVSSEDTVGGRGRKPSRKAAACARHVEESAQTADAAFSAGREFAAHKCGWPPPFLRWT